MDDVGTRFLRSQPLLQTLRERHPDVSVVVLEPPEPPVTPDDAGAGLAELRDVADGVDDAWAMLADRVPGWEPGGRFSQWEAVASRQRRYLLTWVGQRSQEAGAALLAQLAEAVDGGGWATTARPDALVPDLRADQRCADAPGRCGCRRDPGAPGVSGPRHRSGR